MRAINNFMSKSVSKIIIGIVIVSLISSPILVTATNTPAATSTPAAPGSGGNQIEQTLNNYNCITFWSGVPTGVNLAACAALLAYPVFFWIPAQILWFSGKILNITTSFSLNGAMYGSRPIKDAWKVVRDAANIFFLLVILVIAIAMILQLQSYGSQKVLVRAIIVALLINFSFVVGGVIIDATNILALGFYNGINVQTVNAGPSSQDVRDLSAVFISAFNPQGLLSSSKFSTWASDSAGSALGLILIFVLGGIMNLVASFVLLAGGVLFLIRIVVLCFLLVLAPLAFLFMVLPYTQQYASKWWQTLFKYSFFAPAFMFMFYIIARIIGNTGQGGFIGEMGDALNQTIPANGSGFEVFLAGIGTIVIPFFVIIVLMIAALWIAQIMGIAGAATALAWGKAAKSWGQGKISGWTERATGGVAGAARRVAAPAAEAFATGEGKGRITQAAAALGRGTRKIPLVGGALTRGALDIAVAERARIVELQKGYEKYSSAELKNMISRLKPFNRTAIVNELAKRGDLGPGGRLDDAEIVRSKKVMEKYGMRAEKTNIDRLRPDLIPEPVTDKEREYRAGILKTANWEKMDTGTIEKVFANSAMTKEIIKKCGSNVARRVLEIGGKAEESLFGALGRLGDDANKIADELEKMGNRSLAGWARGAPGAQAILNSYAEAEKEYRKSKVDEVLDGKSPAGGDEGGGD
jgi:hypothetical protein